MAPIFAQKNIPDEFKVPAEIIAKTIKDAPYFDEYEGFKNYIMKESGIGGKNLFKSLRLLLTGAEHGPDLAAVYKCIKNYLGEIVK